MFKCLFDLIAFMQLPKDKKRVVFYSEDENYWVHLEALVHQLLEKTDIPVCYISSSKNDPGLQIKNDNFFAFQTDESWIRNWLFENMEAQVVVMSMPDIHQYQVKRSKYPVHYIYVQHSLVSLHMVYRDGAFDHYDTIFCAGPHHVKEMLAIQKAHNLPSKNLVEHGYARLDAIIESAAKIKTDLSKEQCDKPQHVLIAPSWGENGIIERIGMPLVDVLITAGYQVTLRPHPQTYKFNKKNILDIQAKYRANPLFNCENNVAGQESLHSSDVMISDWSGAALDYAFGLGKPVLFIDMPRKINNPSYEYIGIEPFEVFIRQIVGEVVAANNLSAIPDSISRLIKKSTINRDEFVFNVGSSAQAGAEAIMEVLKKND